MDVEVAFLLAMPLPRLPEGASGSCRMAADIPLWVLGLGEPADPSSQRPSQSGSVRLLGEFLANGRGLYQLILVLYEPG
jgi:hypothetical protein